MVLFKKCCCYLELNVGGLIIGWLGLVSGIINFITSTYILASHSYASSENHIAYDIILIANISTSFVSILADSALIIGVYKRNKLIILPWLVTNGIEIISEIATVFIVGITLLFTDTKNAGIVILIFGIPYIAFSVYIWLCIFSLYQKCRDDELQNQQEDQNEQGNENASLVNNEAIPSRD